MHWLAERPDSPWVASALVRANAAAVDPATVRSLDAMHVATAIELASDSTALVAYDKRLGDAATAAGSTWVAPR